MGPERQRRLLLLVLLSLLFVLTSWLEHQHLPSAPDEAVGRRVGRTLKEFKETQGGRGGATAARKGRKADRGRKEEEAEDNFISDVDDEEEEYIKTLQANSPWVSSLRVDVFACLPRFICELHAQAPGADLTDFEKDIIGLFKNHVVLEGPSSPVYPYQVAAHMGQLARGLEPSPCHALYPACPLSRNLLIQLLRSVKTARRMFY